MSPSGPQSRIENNTTNPKVIIESLMLEKTSSIIQSNYQPNMPTNRVP